MNAPQGRRAAASLCFVLVVVLALAGTTHARLNFTLADTNVNFLTSSQEQFLGYHMAVLDAQNHIDGLFPEDEVAIVDRTVVDPRTDNLKLVEQVVLATKEDNPVGFMGGINFEGSFMLNTLLASEGIPQVGTSLVKHLPSESQERYFGATADILSRCKALASFLTNAGMATITLVHAPQDGFTIPALSFAQELPRLGITVLEDLVLGSGQANDVADAILASNNRVVMVFGLHTDLEALLVAAESRNMTQTGEYTWFFLFDTIVSTIVSAPYHAYFPNLTRLVADTNLITFALPDLDTSAPAVQALVARAAALPEVPSAAPYNVTTNGPTVIFASAYDSAMALMRAVNRTMAAGGSPWDHASVINELEATDYEGVLGHLKYLGGYGGLLHTTVFKQYTNPVTDAGVTRANAATYDGLGPSFTAPALVWGTSDGLPPTDFIPDSCGVLFARTPAGVCVACAVGERNDPTDGVEECAFCPDGTELEGGQCVACDVDEEATHLDSGEPRCKPKSESSTDWGVVAGIAVGCMVGTACLVALAALVYRKIERARAEVLEHRAKAKQAQFLGFSFHEMRNPLNVVSSALEFATDTIRRLASDGNKDMDPVLKDLQCGQQSLVDTVHVLDTINMLSQVIHGVVAAEMQPTCPKELAKEVVTLAREVRASMLAHEAEEQGRDDDEKEEDNDESAKGKKRKSIRGSRADGGSDNEDEGSENLQLRVEGGSWGAEAENKEEGKDKEGEGGEEEVKLDTVVLLDNAPIKSREHFVAMDRQKMRQVLLILLINALKYTTKGKITVQIHLKRRSFLLPHSGPNADAAGEAVSVHMSVVDTGSGMPAKDLEHIFDLDYQTERGSVRSTGLGLVLAHRIVAMHGGEMKVRSVHAGNAAAQGMEAGTRFWWEVQSHLIRSSSKPARRGSTKGEPALQHKESESDSGKKPEGTELDDLSQRAKHQPMAPPQAVVLFGKERKPSFPALGVDRANSNTTASSHGNIVDMLRTMPSNLRVLLMEDVKLNRVFMKRKLATYPFSELGWVVEEVETGEQCLELIVDKGAQFDVVFCDQILSNAGGKLLGNEVAKRLREHEARTNAEKRMVLIACSGNASDEDRKVYLESGMDGVVAKPLPNQKALFKFLHPLFVHEV